MPNGARSLFEEKMMLQLFKVLKRRPHFVHWITIQHPEKASEFLIL